MNFLNLEYSQKESHIANQLFLKDTSRRIFCLRVPSTMRADVHPNQCRPLRGTAGKHVYKDTKQPKVPIYGRSLGTKGHKGSNEAGPRKVPEQTSWGTIFSAWWKRGSTGKVGGGGTYVRLSRGPPTGPASGVAEALGRPARC